MNFIRFVSTFFTLNVLFSLVKTEYFTLFIYLITSILLSCVILMFSYLIALQKPNLEKFSSYECGFEPYGDSRTQFEFRFYIIAILFLVFDLETMFLFPVCVSASKLDLLGFWSILDFLIELIASFFYIWYVGALNWD